LLDLKAWLARGAGASARTDLLSLLPARREKEGAA
jgi:hypothetical protein